MTSDYVFMLLDIIKFYYSLEINLEDQTILINTIQFWRQDMEKSESNSEKLAPPNKVLSSEFADVEGAKKAEITAQITLPRDGGWGWVVLFASFCSITILDGLVFTFGAILNDIAEELNVQRPMVALVGSLHYTLYLMLSPIASALINRFGFRICGMCGGMICCFSVLSSTFARTYGTFIVLYGVCQGIGSSFTSMAAYLVVGLYFQKYRRVALITVTSGSSIGMMCLSPTNMVLVKLGGWRPTVLFHSGLLGLIFFLALTYKPLVSLSVAKTEDAAVSTRTVIFLPNENPPPGSKPIANATERILGAVTNARYPTAASVVQEPIQSLSSIPESSAEISKPRIRLSTSHNISQAQVNQVKSIISKGTVEDLRVLDIKIQNEHEPREKKSCWGRLCYWPSHVKSARPLYRDDAFYDGKMKNLPQYRKSIVETGDKSPGLEYQMKVSRAATIQDLNDRRGLCTAAVKRVLATMFNWALLKRNSFKILCLAGVCNYLGVLTPLTYLQHRNLEAGISPHHCRLFLSVVGFFNALGRILWCLLSTKISPSYLYSGGLLSAGLLTIISGLSYSLAYQYGFCVLFGITVSVSNAMRSLMIVDLYGLELLTNGTGMLLLFMGIGNVFSTPVAGVLRNHFGYDSAFYFAGVCLTLAGVISSPVKIIRNREIHKTVQEDQNENDKREMIKPAVNKVKSILSQDSNSEQYILNNINPKNQNPAMSKFYKKETKNKFSNEFDEIEHKNKILQKSLLGFRNYYPPKIQL